MLLKKRDLLYSFVSLRLSHNPIIHYLAMRDHYVIIYQLTLNILLCIDYSALYYKSVMTNRLKVKGNWRSSALILKIILLIILIIFLYKKTCSCTVVRGRNAFSLSFFFFVAKQQYTDKADEFFALLFYDYLSNLHV